MPAAQHELRSPISGTPVIGPGAFPFLGDHASSRPLSLRVRSRSKGHPSRAGSTGGAELPGSLQPFADPREASGRGGAQPTR